MLLIVVADPGHYPVRSGRPAKTAAKHPDGAATAWEPRRDVPSGQPGPVVFPDGLPVSGQALEGVPRFPQQAPRYMASSSLIRLTPVQRGMVFHQVVDPRSGVDIEQIVVTLHEPVEVVHLRSAWCQVVASHRALHSKVVESGSGDYRLAPDPLSCPELDEIDVPATDPEAFLQTWLAEDRSRGFDIFARVPMRISLLQRAGTTAICVWSFHHVLLDGRSFADVLLEVWDAYDRLLAGRPVAIPERPDTAPFLAWLSDRDHSRSLAYWQELLAGFADATAFPDDAPTSMPVRSVLARQLDVDLTASIQQWAQANEVTVSSVIEAAWATLLARHADRDDVTFGAVRAGRAGHVADTARMLGVFINTVPVRAMVGRSTGIDLVRALRRQQLDTRLHEHVPLARIQVAIGVAGELSLFRTLVVFDRETLDATVRRQRPGWNGRHFELHEQTLYPLTLYAYAGRRMMLRLACFGGAFAAEQGPRLLDHLASILRGIVNDPLTEVRQLPMLSQDERRLLHQQWSPTARVVAPTSIHAAFERAVAAHPALPALTGAGRTLDYAQLDRAAAVVAASLAGHGVARGDLVGLSLDRSPELVVAMLGILKAGAAYLPLDPGYPAERLDFCIRDSGIALVLTQRRHAHRFKDPAILALPIEDLEDSGVSAAAGAGVPTAPEDLAYTIYTSGSSGSPKGVQVTHANVVNFFAGMDEVVRVDAQKRWLAVTSASFDISVLELLWTLTRGFEVVVHGARKPADPRRPTFSLFHFASGMDAADPDPYRLILEAAKFADRNGLEAVWSPERHFHDFGAPYPNPSVMNAALATITSRVALRAGSVVLPLHDPIRVVEEWSLVDRLSHGRVGVSFASGWQPNDFVLAPANYACRKERMFEQIETVRALWRGERIRATNPVGDEFLLGTYPRPVQAELPIWVTAAGNPETFRQAGDAGANILTHMLGQSPADLAANIELYRQARATQGLDPAGGRVTVMVHTFISEDTDQVRELVRDPMKRYLRSAASLVGNYADAWSAYKRGAGSPVAATAMSELTVEELEELYDFAFERYFQSSGLFGSVEKCAPLVDALQRAGVDEIACLIDFGVAPATVIEHLPWIARLKDLPERAAVETEDDIVRAVQRHRISHLQCTPSQARMIPMLVETPAQLASLRQVLVGGEALPADLAKALYELLPDSAGIVNMYGPTETTIWSTTEPVARDAAHISIGRPIANTCCLMLDSHRQCVPPGCIGELHIGGAGVARGYLGRDELNAERFFELSVEGRVQRVYATGDRVRLLADGRIEYLGRTDFQLKVRGHRVEPGEIEMALREQAGVADAVVTARVDSAGSQQLVGHVIAERTGSLPSTETLKHSLRSRLPEHLVPDSLIWLESLPLTPNGKIDRRALSLATPDASVGALPTIASPDTETIDIIRDIWKRVLGLPHIGTRDNFFELGGHSILAVKAQSELSRAFGRRLPIAELFRSPTIESLAAHFASGPSTDADIVRTAAAGKASARRNAMKRRGAQERQGP